MSYSASLTRNVRQSRPAVSIQTSGSKPPPRPPSVITTSVPNPVPPKNNLPTIKMIRVEDNRKKYNTNYQLEEDPWRWLWNLLKELRDAASNINPQDNRDDDDDDQKKRLLNNALVKLDCLAAKDLIMDLNDFHPAQPFKLLNLPSNGLGGNGPGNGGGGPGSNGPGNGGGDPGSTPGSVLQFIALNPNLISSVPPPVRCSTLYNGSQTLQVNSLMVFQEVIEEKKVSD